MQNTAASSNTIAAISRLIGPSGTDSPIVMTGPSSAPAVPPAPMKPNSRLPCSASNRSAMNDQNTATANRLNTLTQTKNTRARQLCHQRTVERLSYKQRHEGSGEQPRQVPDAAGDAHLVAKRPEHVIAGKEREEIGEGPQRRCALLR